MAPFRRILFWIHVYYSEQACHGPLTRSIYMHMKIEGTNKSAQTLTIQCVNQRHTKTTHIKSYPAYVFVFSQK